MLKNWIRRTVLLLTVCMFSGCSENPSTCSQSVLRINFPSDPTTLDPRKGRDVTTSCIHFMLYEGLTRMTPRSTADFGVASSIEISEDKKRYTFHLRESFWSDGMPVVAEDFSYAWLSMLDPAFPAPNVNLLYPIKNAEKAKRGEVPLTHVGIQVVDPHTLVVELEAPTPYFLELTAFCTFSPIPFHVAENNPQWPNDNMHIVTNGPYEIQSWQNRDEMDMRTSDTYWDRESVGHDGVHITFIENQSTALQLFEKGEIDMMGTAFTGIPIDSIHTLKKDGALSVFPIAATTFCSFNTKRKPFTSVKVRRALSLALDRGSIVKNITELDEEAGFSLIPSVLRKEKNLHIFSDAQPEPARKLLEEGFAELGITLESFHPILLYSMSEVNHKVAQEIQQQWKKSLGISAELQTYDKAIFLERIQRRDYDVALSFLYAQYNDPMNILERFRLASNPKNYPGWEDATFRGLIDELFTTTCEEKRASLAKAAEEYLLAQMPLTPIYHWTTCFIKQPTIKNVYFSPLGAVHIPSITKERTLSTNTRRAQ